MKSDYDYQLPRRPNFEAATILGWLAGAGLAYGLGVRSGLPLLPFWGLIGTCLGMAAWHTPASGSAGASTGASAMRNWPTRS